MDDWIKFQMKLRPEMTENLDAEAESLGISRAALIRVILNNHLRSK